MKSFSDRMRRLEALEEGQEQAWLRFPDFTRAVLVAYGTPEDLAAWEAEGCPPITKAEFEQALERVYEGLI